VAELFLGGSRPLRLRRVAGREDVLDATNVWLRSRDAAVPAIPPRIHDDDDVRQWFETTNWHARELYVAEEPASGIIGMMVLHDDWIDQLYIEPSWNRQGIGSEFIALAKRLRPNGLQLWTFQSNAGARRFYEWHGFRAVQFTDGENEEGEPDVRYEWP
jgi:GNAT superfamily N-acetyltransferase